MFLDLRIHSERGRGSGWIHTRDARNALPESHQSPGYAGVRMLVRMFVRMLVAGPDERLVITCGYLLHHIMGELTAQARISNRKTWYENE